MKHWNFFLAVCVLLNVAWVFGDCEGELGIGSTCESSCPDSPSVSGVCSGGAVCCSNFFMKNAFKFYDPPKAPWQKTALMELQNTLQWYLEFRKFSCMYRNQPAGDGSSWCGGEDGKDPIEMTNVAFYYNEEQHQNDALDYLQQTLMADALKPAAVEFVKKFRNVGGGEGYLPPAPSQGGTSCTTRYQGFTGTCIDVNQCTGATFNGLCPGATNIKCCVTETTPANPATEYLSQSTFNRLFNGISAPRTVAFRPYLNDALGQILRDNPSENVKCHRIAAFVAQISHESVGLLYFEEISSGSQYNGRCSDLGNCQPGDGPRFKGRGPIQLTGRANYRSASNDLGTDWEQRPEEVCFPSAGFLAATWYWNRNNLNRFCTGDYNDFTALSRAINGGLNGISDRRSRWSTAKSLLGCGAPTSSFMLESMGYTNDTESRDALREEVCEADSTSSSGFVQPLIFLTALILVIFF